MNYVGRFAPSPTGKLHLGTLVTAVASYLHARQSAGEWLVRIEDIDPPREIPGATAAILSTLEALDLAWDRDVRYQSTCLDNYRDTAADLVLRRLAYYCNCSRRQIRGLTGNTQYPGTCRDKDLPPGDAALRLRLNVSEIAFRDHLLGRITRNIEAEDGDFVIVRRDGLPAYHLAVVVDDAAQGVTDVVRGADLLNSTPLHICLQQQLGLPTPRYWHIPVVTNAKGEKLSKQQGAPGIDPSRPQAAAARALELLGLTLPQELAGAPPRELWDWALANFQIASLARLPGFISLPD
jgi:glutamyl-Q tRNA(Asp) synthetase